VAVDVIKRGLHRAPLRQMAMETEVLATWSSVSAECRRQAVAVRDPELLDALQSSMRAMLQAEVQTQGQDEALELLLTSAMEFDTPPEGSTAPKAMMWPMRLHEDAASMMNAVSHTLGKDAPWKALPPQSWADIVNPLPSTWADFERILAQLVQQMILHELPTLPKMSWATMSSPVIAAVRSVAPGSPQIEELELCAGTDEEEDADAEVQGNAGLGSTARAAKRLRQRERRKMGRRALAQGGEAADEPEALASTLDPSAKPFVMPGASALLSASAAPTTVAQVVPGGIEAAKGTEAQAAVTKSAAKAGRKQTLPPSSEESISTMACSSSESAPGDSSGGSHRAMPSPGKEPGAEPTPPLAEAPADVVADVPDRHPPSSFMDGMQARLEKALADLEAGNTDTCKEHLQGALHLCSGLNPYLEHINKPMSRNWERLRQATQKVDWQELVASKETKQALSGAMAPAAMTVRTLQFLCHTLRASRCLQIGTFTGGAALGLAEALPAHGRVVALERDPFLAEFARRQLSVSSNGEKVSIVSGNVLELLKCLPARTEGDRFQLIFVDGNNKNEYLAYLDRILERDLLGPGGILVVDDVLWQGGVYSEAALDADGSPGVRPHDREVASVMAGFNERLVADRRFEPVVLPVANGLALIRRRSLDEVLGDLQLTPGHPAKVTVSMCSEFDDFELGPALDTMCDSEENMGIPLIRQMSAPCAGSQSRRSGLAAGVWHGLDGVWVNPQAFSSAAHPAAAGGMKGSRQHSRTMSMASDAPNTLWPSTPEDSPMLHAVMPW